MNQSDCEGSSFESTTTHQELVVVVDDYEVDYTWGDGAKKHFLNVIELHIQGKHYADRETFPAIVCFTTRNGKEPEPYDSDLFVPGAPGLGKIELATTLQIHAAVTMGSMQNILEILKLDKRKDLLFVCSRFISDSLGRRNADLIRFTLSSKVV